MQNMPNASKAGLKESALEALFLAHCYACGDCRFTAYPCVCASGIHTAVLHYPQNNAQLTQQSLCLFDMGAQYEGYCADITCTYPSNGHFTQRQREIYEIVLRAQCAVLREMRAGVAWPHMHRLAETIILEGLRDLGIYLFINYE